MPILRCSELPHAEIQIWLLNPQHWATDSCILTAAFRTANLGRRALNAGVEYFLSCTWFILLPRGLKSNAVTYFASTA